MTDLETMSDILTRGTIDYTICDWKLKESDEKGKFINIRQGRDEVYIEFDSSGEVIKNYD